MSGETQTRPRDTGLREQIEAMRELLDALARERAALAGHDAVALEAAVREKQALLDRLRVLAQPRASWTTQTDPSGPPRLRHPTEPRAPEEELARLADRCRRENRVNGALLEATRQQTAQLLAIVTGRAPEGGSTYDPRGGNGSRIGARLQTRA